MSLGDISPFSKYPNGLLKTVGLILLFMLLGGYSCALKQLKYTPGEGKEWSSSKTEHLIQTGELDKAIAQLKQAVAINPAAERQQLLGLAYQKKSQQLTELSIEAYEAAIVDTENSKAARLSLGDIYYQQGKYAKCIEVLAPLTSKSDAPLAARILLARAYFNVGQLTQSLAEWEKLSKLKPEGGEAEFHIGFLKEKKELYEEALEHYQKVISSAPQSKWAADAQNRLDVLEAVGGVLTLAGIEDEEIRQIIKNAPGTQEYHNAGAIMLLDEVSYTVHDNHTMTTRIHRLIKVLNERGKGFGEVKLNYDSSQQTVKVNLARTIKPDGTIVNVGKKSMRDLTPWSGFPLYSNAKVKVVSMPEVMAGSIIEYIATIESAELLNEDDFQFGIGLQSHEPQLLQRIILDVPQDRQLKIKYLRLADVSPKVEQKDDRRMYTWEVRDMPEIISEPLMPPWADISPFIMVSSFTDWDEISAWFNDLAKDQFKLDEAIRQKVAELIAEAATPEDKARHIFHFVASEIRYVGLEYGVSGYKPHKATEIFKNKYGDCKDQSTLLVAMLREVGIPAYLVLISTRGNGRLEKDIPMLQFDHCIAAARLGGKLVWLDPTCETCSLDDIPEGDQQRQALVMFDEGARFISTPLLEAENNKMLKRVELEIKSDGSVDGNSKLITSGDYSVSYRGVKYTKPIRRKHMLQSLVNGMYPGGRLLDYAFTGLEEMDGPVTISLHYTGPSYLKSAGDLRLFQLPGVGSSARGVSREERTYPVQFSGTSWTEVHTTIKIPAEYRVRYLPGEIKLELPAASYWSHYENRDGVIHYFERDITKDVEIAVDDYQQYKEYREKIAQEADQQIILEEK